MKNLPTFLINDDEINNKTGILTEIQKISVFPPHTINNELSSDSQDNTVKIGDIHITPDGKWLYVSERATKTITAFSVDDNTGNLTYSRSYETEEIPRGFNIDPNGKFVIVAGQKSDYVAVHAINPETGELKLLDRFESGNEPNWIEIVEFY